MTTRNDPSSLSFGTRLRRVENESANNKRRVRELEETSLDRDQKADANERRRLKRAETVKASALLVSGQASLDDLHSIDQTLLPLAQRDLIQQEIVAKGFAAAMPSLVQLTPDAMERIKNWQASFDTDDSQMLWEMNNAKPEPSAKEQWARSYYAQRKQQEAIDARENMRVQPKSEHAKQRAELARLQEMKRTGKFLNNPLLSKLGD